MDTIAIKKHLIELTRLGIKFDTSEGALNVRGNVAALDQDARVFVTNYKQNIIEILDAAQSVKPKMIHYAQVKSPLSFQQNQLWLIDRLNGDSSQYNMPACLHLKGKLDRKILQQVMNNLLASHPSLRTSIREDESGKPFQFVCDTNNIDITEIDISHLSLSKQNDSVQTICQEEAVRQFNLSSDLLFRATLLRLSENQYKLLITLHHIISDGWSIGILVKHFCEFYSAACRGRKLEPIVADIQYSDFAIWQRECLDSGYFDKHLNYWNKELSELPLCHSLPLDFSRPGYQTFNGDRVERKLTGDLAGNVLRYCKENNVTLFNVLHAAFSSLLYKYTNDTDIVIGTPVACRQQSETEQLFGFLANSCVLRTDFSRKLNFNKLVFSCKEAMDNALEHQDVPFELVVNSLKHERSPSFNPLFQIMIVMDNAGTECFDIDGLKIDIEDLSQHSVHFDLVLNASIANNEIILTWEYNSDLFKKTTLDRFSDQFNHLLSQAISTPDIDLNVLPMRVEEELSSPLAAQSSSRKTELKYQNFVDYFWHQANTNPDNIAVVDRAIVDGADEYSYAEVTEKAQLIAYQLKSEGVKPADVVGIHLVPGITLCASMFAVTLVGGTFVFIDTQYPQNRIDYLVHNSNMSHLISGSNSANVLAHMEVELIVLDWAIMDSILPMSEFIFDPETPACMFYTSGSTGEPKGVLFSHRGLSNYAQSMNIILKVKKQSRFLQMASIGFDVFLEELLPCWYGGGRVVLGGAGILAVEDLHKKLFNDGITCFEISFAHWREWLAWMKENQCSPPKTLVSVMVGCDAIPNYLMEQWSQYDVELHHVFGLTETTITTTVWSSEASDYRNYRTMPIGQPIDNTSVYVLNDDLLPVPIGVSGELYVGGEGVALGYHNKDDLTKSSFINLDIQGQDSVPVYKTGDYVRRLDDGSIQFIGRNDEQIKVRGFRVELGEVEAAILQCTSINQATVLAIKDNDGNKLLVGYVCCNQPFVQAVTREELKSIIPDYMIPSLFVELSHFPLNENGKIDKKALKMPDLSQLQEEYIAPTNNIQKQICDVWSLLFEVEKISIEDSFFSLGGHSLLIMKMIPMLKQQGFNIEPRQIFSHATVKALANLIEQGDERSVMTHIAPARIIPENCQQITPEMLPLIQLTSKEIEVITNIVSGGTENIQDIYPLAPLQKGMLYHHLLDDDADPYIMSAVFFVEKDRIASLLEGIEFLVNRHDVLRTAIVVDGLEEPVQVVLKKSLPFITRVKLDPVSNEDERVKQLKAYEVKKMALAKPPLWQFLVGECEEGYYVLLQEHHLINDHVGLDILKHELSVFLEREAESLSAAPQYRDFISYTLDTANKDETAKFWQSKIGHIEKATLPFGESEVDTNEDSMEFYSEVLPLELSQRIRQLSKSSNYSVATFFHAAWSILVSASSSEQEVVFGTVMSGRLQPVNAIDKIMGSFINTLPLCVSISNQTIPQLLENLQKTLRELVNYEQTPLSLVQSLCGLPSGSPLITSILNYRVSDLDLEVVPGFYFLDGQEQNNYPLSLSVDDLGEKDTFRLEFQAVQGIGAKRVAKMFLHLVDTVYASAKEESKALISLLPLLSPSEMQTQTVDWNGKAETFASDKTLVNTFEAQVIASPDSIALETIHNQLSYQELNKSANQVAHYLKSKGVCPGDLVGLYHERDEWLLIGLLGILKTGAGYVPIDSKYPKSRVAYMISDARLSCVLTQSALKSQLNDESVQVEALDEETVMSAVTKMPECNLNIGNDSDALAYVIYTSGSTGNPKGVSIAHRSVQSLLHWSSQTYHDDEISRVLFGTSVCFDLSVFEIWGALSRGGSVLLVENVLDLIEHQALAPSLINTVPSALSSLLESSLLPNSVKVVNVAGEPLKQRLVNSVMSLAHVRRMYNLYGPSEDTTYSTYAEFNQVLAEDEAPSIGKPLPNTEVYVLNEEGHIQPRGVVGELYIAGEGLSKGYLHQQELTADKFINIHIVGLGEKRVYRTGDLVRWCADGQLSFISRTDYQVKIRGFRIELGEIEHQLSLCAGVNESVVVAYEEESNHYLVAYFSVVDGVSAEEVEQGCRSRLSEVLAEYMVPQHFVCLESLPLTSNGKVDRSALKAPQQVASSEGYVAPRTELEHTLCGIWEELLNEPRVGIKDNFFTLGGHSLLILKMIAKIQDVGYQVSIKQVLKNPCIEQLNKVLMANLSGASFAYNVPAYEIPVYEIPEHTGQLNPDMFPLLSVNQIPVNQVPVTQDELDGIIEHAGGNVKNIKDIYPLVPLQEGMLFHHCLDASKDPYVSPALLKVADKSTLDKFVEALNFVISRHDALRTAILWRNREQPVQVVYRKATVTVDLINFDKGVCVESSMRELYASDDYVIDIEKAPLVRMQVAEIPSTGEYLIFFKHHHLVIDHISFEILFHEISMYLNSKQELLPEPVQFRNFVAHALLQNDKKREEEFFQDYLGDIKEPTYPFDLTDIHSDGRNVEVLPFDLLPELSEQIRRISQNLGVNTAAIFHAAWGLVIAACSNQDDVVFGSVLSGRLQGSRGAEYVMGMTLNTLPFRVKLGGQSAHQLVSQVYETFTNILEFEQVSLADANRYCGLNSDTPLFSANINFRHTDNSKIEQFSSASGVEYIEDRDVDNYLFSMSVDDFGDGFGLEVQVIKSIGAKRIADYFLIAIQQMLDAIECQDMEPAMALPILKEQEINTLTLEWNDTQREVPKEKCLVSFLSIDDEHKQDSIAISDAKTKMTYGQLHKKSNQLAGFLVEHGVSAGEVVGIYAEPGVEVFVSLLAIMKLGGTFVLLDKNYPESRIDLIIKDSKIMYLLVDQPCSAADNAVQLTIDLKGVQIYPTEFTPGNDTQHPACMFYTSGSTGIPKGVKFTQLSLINYTQSMTRKLGCDDSSKFLQMASIGFDVVLEEILPCWFGGGTVVIADRAQSMSLEGLSDTLFENQITHFEISLSHWKAWLQWMEENKQRPPESLKRVLVGCESISKLLMDKWQSFGIPLVHVFGLTETAITTTTWESSTDIDESYTVMPIGKPIDNTSVYILNSCLTPVPIGAIGELYIGGLGMPDGYHNRPEESQERFINNPFGKIFKQDNLELLYKTGDLARWLPDGNLQFIGRNDEQIKVRGFRVEPAEIEACLLSCLNVKSAVVIADKQNDETRLLAYVVGNKQGTEQTQSKDLMTECKDTLRNNLPDYMQPNFIIEIDEIPLTINGKLDKSALIKPESSVLKNQYIAPETEAEKVVVDVCSAILGIDTNTVSVKDNFFVLGGTSLSAMKLSSRLQSRGFNVQIQSIFESRTFSELALVLAIDLDKKHTVSSLDIVTNVNTNQKDELVI